MLGTSSVAFVDVMLLESRRDIADVIRRHRSRHGIYQPRLTSTMHGVHDSTTVGRFVLGAHCGLATVVPWSGPLFEPTAAS